MYHQEYVCDYCDKTDRHLSVGCEKQRKVGKTMFICMCSGCTDNPIVSGIRRICLLDLNPPVEYGRGENQFFWRVADSPEWVFIDACELGKILMGEDTQEKRAIISSLNGLISNKKVYKTDAERRAARLETYRKANGKRVKK